MVRLASTCGAPGRIFKEEGQPQATRAAGIGPSIIGEWVPSSIWQIVESSHPPPHQCLENSICTRGRQLRTSVSSKMKMPCRWQRLSWKKRINPRRCELGGRCRIAADRVPRYLADGKEVSARRTTIWWIFGKASLRAAASDRSPPPFTSSALDWSPAEMPLAAAPASS